jgi:hypothetical protein
MFLLIASCGSDSDTKAHSDSERGFSSSIRIQYENSEMIGNFYYERGRYRLEFRQDTLEPILMVNENTNSVILAFPLKRAYTEISLAEYHSTGPDLFQAVKLAADKYSVETVKSDTLYGMPCEKQLITQDSADLFAQWVSDKYPFPLRVEEFTGSKRILELFGMRKKLLGDLYFSVPDFFINLKKQKVMDEQDLAREIVPDSTKLKIIERQPPIKELVIVNDQLEVQLDTAKQVTVRFKNGTDKPAVCHISFYRGGQLLTKNENGPRNYGEVSIKKLGIATQNTWKAYADKFVARVDRGKMFIEVSQPEIE